jgi:hypothetical protein
MAAVIAALLVIATGASLLATEPRGHAAPPPLVLSGNLAAFVSLAPVALARVRGDR